MKTKRIPTRIRTRKLDRAVAKNVMRAKGIIRFNKHDNGLSSYFADNWRKYV